MPCRGLAPASAAIRPEDLESFRQNLKDHWNDHLAHLFVGGTAGWLAGSGDWPQIAAAFLIMAVVGLRQTLEFLRRRDTPGYDLAYHLAALVALILYQVVDPKW